jgi:hypothetical protein
VLWGLRNGEPPLQAPDRHIQAVIEVRWLGRIKPPQRSLISSIRLDALYRFLRNTIGRSAVI